MSVEDRTAVRMLRVAGAFVLNLIAAIFGPASIESPIWAALPRARSFAGIEAREWILGLTCAGLLGFFISRRWPSKTAAWVWTLPLLVFALRALVYRASEPNSVLVGDGFWKHFFAPDCYGRYTCQDYLVFTIPAARAVVYSAAAWASLRFRSGQVMA